ncbi:MAG TPA: protein phosphatase 2C domain-containing protein [Polyangiaceae bacterium]|nr:protein phosphatase 2C domain-containing protein [Polyangiaceae bacterium]
MVDAPTILLEVAQRSDPGRDPNKQINEDAMGHRPTRLGHLLVVCDGMGGHALGQEASHLAVATIIRVIEASPPNVSPGTALVNAIVEAGHLVYRMGGQGEQQARPGSTCVAVLVHPLGAEIAHVGDSRVYLMRRGQVWQLTKDHSVVQQMVDRGEITAEQASLHPEANKITRALGIRPETLVELRDPPFVHAPGDLFLLASDGLSDLVRAEEIARVVANASSLDAACLELVGMANARGGHDNITVQIARLPQSPRAHITLPDHALADRGPPPTLMEPPLQLQQGSDKTLVDPNPPSPTPTVPQAMIAPIVALEPPSPERATLPIPMPPVVPDEHQGAPSQGGWVVLAVGLATFVLIVSGVVTWWLLRRSP